MRAVIDLHTHTLSSGHAFSTFKENLEEGSKRGLLAFGTSDHAPKMPGSSHPIFFDNYKVIPGEINEVKIFTGIEANIYDYEGTIDVEMPTLRELDYVIASLHWPCIKSGTAEENTNALIGAMKNPYVKIIGHPDDDRYPLDYDRLVRAAKEYKVALELNNSSLRPRATRQNGRINAGRLLEKCMQYEAMIIMGSDSHICYDVGRFTEACELLDAVGFPEELVINTGVEKLPFVINRPGRA